MIIETVEKVTALLVSLAQARESSARRHLEDHVDPVYNGAKEIFNALMALLDSIQQQLADPEVSVEAILADSKAMLMTNWDKRWDLTHYASALHDGKIRPASIADFAKDVLFLLEDTENEITQRFSGSVIDMIEIVVMKSKLFPNQMNDLRENLGAKVKHKQQKLQVIWKRISETYHRTRVQCMK